MRKTSRRRVKKVGCGERGEFIEKNKLVGSEQLRPTAFHIVWLETSSSNAFFFEYLSLAIQVLEFLNFFMNLRHTVAADH